MAPESGTAFKIRHLRSDDLAEVIRIDAQHTGKAQRPYWRGVFSEFLASRGPRAGKVGLAADAGEGLAGYLFGEVRAAEFGSEPCGWVFAVGVDVASLRQGVASALLEAAKERFRRADVATIRTMVRRNDVPVLSFFRAGGFVGGPFVQLELDLSEED